MNGVELTVHRATRQIGGNLVEIAAPTGERLVIDAGCPLDAAPGPPGPLLPPTLDLSRPATVLISHAHRDHWGLLAGLPGTWPVWSGAATERLIRLTAAIAREPLAHAFRHWTPGVAVEIGDFRITPILTDHSAMDAYMLLVEVAEKRVLYSGDFRTHGRKGSLVRRLISRPPERIDVLVMEGTNLGQDKPVLSETALEDRFVDLFARTRGRVFVAWSPQNVDRTVTLFRACRKAGRTLAVDLYSAEVMEAVGEFGKLPRPGWDGMRVFLTSRLRHHYVCRGMEGFVGRMAASGGIGASALAVRDQDWVIAVRASLIHDLSRKGVKPGPDDAWSFSMWRGYLGEENGQRLAQWFDAGGSAAEHLHTSGHACADDLRLFASAVDAGALVPVHGASWDEHTLAFPRVRRLADGETMRM